MGEANKNTGIAKRLRILLDVLFPKKSIAAISRETDLNPQTLSNYLAGRLPGPDFLLALAERDADITWLLTGRGTPTIVAADHIGRPKWSLEALNDNAIILELRSRVKNRITEAFRLVHEMSATDLSDLAQHIQTASTPSDLTPGDFSLARSVYEAFWIVDHVRKWFPNLDRLLEDQFFTLLRLYHQFIGRNDVRTIACRYIELVMTGSVADFGKEPPGTEMKPTQTTAEERENGVTD